MRTKPLRLVLILAALSAPAWADAPVPTPSGPAPAPATPAATPQTNPTPTPTPVPTMPGSITLTNGTVLRNISVVRWQKESVTLKHTGGADTIYYAYIAEPDRTTVLAVRDDALKNKKGDASTKVTDNSVKGTIIVSNTDSDNVPLAQVKVYAIRIDALNLFATDGSRVSLPKPIASTVTGADGQFSLTVPAGVEYFIFAKAAQQVGQTWEHYEWRVPLSQVGDRQNVTLTSAGMIPLAEQKGVVFEP